jgi:hypothetical protein
MKDNQAITKVEHLLAFSQSIALLCSEVGKRSRSDKL